MSGAPEIDVRLALRAPRTLSGRVVFDTPQRSGSSAARQVMLSPAPGPASLPIGGTLQAPVEAGGTFTIPNVVPGRYILRASGGLLRSSVVEGQDTLDIPIEITGERDITGAVVTVISPDRQTTLWGRIADGSDEPLSNVTVVVAATDERYWVPGGRRVVVIRTDAWGNYRVGGLPPGARHLHRRAGARPRGRRAVRPRAPAVHRRARRAGDAVGGRLVAPGLPDTVTEGA